MLADVRVDSNPGTPEHDRGILPTQLRRGVMNSMPIKLTKNFDIHYQNVSGTRNISLLCFGHVL